MRVGSISGLPALRSLWLGLYTAATIVEPDEPLHPLEDLRLLSAMQLLTALDFPHTPSDTTAASAAGPGGSRAQSPCAAPVLEQSPCLTYLAAAVMSRWSAPEQYNDMVRFGLLPSQLHTRLRHMQLHVRTLCDVTMRALSMCTALTQLELLPLNLEGTSHGPTLHSCSPVAADLVAAFASLPALVTLHLSPELLAPPPAIAAVLPPALVAAAEGPASAGGGDAARGRTQLGSSCYTGDLPPLRSLQPHDWTAAFMAAAPQLHRVDAQLLRYRGSCFADVLCWTCLAVLQISRVFS